MSYITVDDLKALIPLRMMAQLSVDDVEMLNDAYDTNTVNEAIVNKVMAGACEVVDGYMRGRYSLPFAKTPTLVKQCAEEIARYKLYSRRPEGFELPKAVRDGYTDALKMLEKIRDGKISIGVQALERNGGQIISDDGEFHVSVRPSKDKMAAFGRETLDKW